MLSLKPQTEIMKDIEEHALLEESRDFWKAKYQETFNKLQSVIRAWDEPDHGYDYDKIEDMHQAIEAVRDPNEPSEEVRAWLEDCRQIMVKEMKSSHPSEKWDGAFDLVLKQSITS